jgi:hypothetical protein
LKLHEIAPEDIVPNGDRYLVEVIDIDEKVLLGQLLVVTQNEQLDARGNPLADPTVERRGVLAAVVISVGNGHLLGLPDIPMTSKVGTPQEETENVWASVPMFYEPGDVVLIDHNAKGRALKIAGRELRIVNQIDILAQVSGVLLQRTEDGKTWEQVSV